MPEAMVARAHPLPGVVELAAPALTLRPLPPAARLSVRADADAAVALGAALGIRFGTEPCRAVAAGDLAALWLGPDEWLLLAPAGQEHLLLQRGATSGAMLVDVSHRNAAIEVGGPAAEDVLNAFVALDLALAAFPIGMCTRTVFAKAEVVLWRTDTQSFRVEPGRSFAFYVWDCLLEAAREAV